MTPWDNFHILGYRGPNGTPKDIPERAQNVILVVRILDSEDELVTHGMTYNFTVLNNPVTGHLGKMIINPNWWNLWCWIRDMWGYLSAKLQTQRSSNFGDITETVTIISAEEIGKLGLPVPKASHHCFQKRGTLDSLPWRGPYFCPIISLKFQFWKIRVSLTNPRSASSKTRSDTSNQTSLILKENYLDQYISKEF